MNTPVEITIDELIVRHEALFFDAYGVLVDDHGPLPGVIDLIRRLNTSGMPYYVLTNSASRLPESIAAHFRELGLAIPAERLISSGLLLSRYAADHQLQRRRAVVLGPEDAREYARRAGLDVMEPEAGLDAEVVVIADEKGYPLLEYLDHVLSLLLRRLDQRRPVELLVCNPDLIYPQAPARYGFTAGTLAAMYEGILRERYGTDAPHFTRLGKPYAPLFEEAVRRAGTSNAVMIGDQLATDIRGANRFGLASALVATGLGGSVLRKGEKELVPDFRLPGLESRR